MTFYLQYEVDSSQAEEFFKIAGYRARNMNTPFSRVAGRIRSIIFKQFETEGEVFPTPGHAAWAPLNSNYQAGKVDPRIGRLTGIMFESAVHGVKQGGNYVELHVTRHNEEDSTDIVEVFQEGRDPSPQVNHKGDSYMGGRQPERPIWETTGEFREEVQLIFWKWLSELKSFNRSRAKSPLSALTNVQIHPTYIGY